MVWLPQHLCLFLTLLRGPADEKPVDGEKSPDAPRPMETVDACWGEGLEEKEYPLQGDETNEKDPVGDDVENVKNHDGGDGEETEYEPSIMVKMNVKNGSQNVLRKLLVNFLDL